MITQLRAWCVFFHLSLVYTLVAPLLDEVNKGHVGRANSVPILPYQIDIYVIGYMSHNAIKWPFETFYDKYHMT